jgi:hypothetical protein
MKNLLMWLGGIFFVVLLGVGGLIAYLANAGAALDTSSKAYVDEAVPAIVARWSKEQLAMRAAAQFRAAASDQQLTQVFAKFSQLGALKTYDGSKGESHTSLTPQQGKVVTAAYLANATFEKGPAQISVRLVQADGQWQILHFAVNSPMFSR